MKKLDRSDSLQFNNLKLKMRFWVEIKHKSINFADGYLHSNFDIINQYEYKQLLKYAKSLIK